jgi:hypothetical protein
MLNLTLIRNHLEHRLRLTTLEESNRLEAQTQRKAMLVWLCAGIAGALCGWALAELIDKL